MRRLSNLSPLETFRVPVHELLAKLTGLAASVSALQKDHPRILSMPDLADLGALPDLLTTGKSSITYFGFEGQEQHTGVHPGKHVWLITHREGRPIRVTTHVIALRPETLDLTKAEMRKRYKQWTGL
jgi:hypothetical protein